MTFREVTLRGHTARRTVRPFGLDYAYETGELVTTDPLPAELGALRDRCAALIERDPADLAQILVSRYPEGAGIGWHRDAPMFGSRIAGVSLGAACRMRFQRTVGGTPRGSPALLRPRSGHLPSRQAGWAWPASTPATPASRHSRPM